MVTLLRNDEQHKDHPVALSLEHAQNLLRIQEDKNISHFTLPKDSPYEFKNGNLIRRPSQRTAPKSEE